MTDWSEVSELRKRALQVAKRHLGEAETPGRPNRGPLKGIVTTAQLFIGRWMLGQPWCAAFATYCVHLAAREMGVPCERIRSASSSELYRYFRRTGTLLFHPEPGCIGLVVAGPKARKLGKTHEHTFLVHDIQGDEVVTVEGNWSNRVRWNRRKINGALVFGKIR